jgi:hypothetical protein
MPILVVEYEGGLVSVEGRFQAVPMRQLLYGPYNSASRYHACKR